jgi:hypothetical protein
LEQNWLREHLIGCQPLSIGVEHATEGVVGPRSYMSKYVTLGCSCYFHMEEGWVVETLLYYRQVFLDDILIYSRRTEELDEYYAWFYSVCVGTNHENC